VSETVECTPSTVHTPLCVSEWLHSLPSNVPQQLAAMNEMARSSECVCVCECECVCECLKVGV
jgi:hypothetical protein